MKKIAFVYLDVTNLGDVIISDTARYICDDILKKSGVDYELVPIDIGSYQYRKKINIFIIAFFILLSRLIICTGRLINGIFPGLAKKLFVAGFHTTLAYRYFKQTEFDKLLGCDLILFCGGGLIKYHRQNFHFYLNEIIGYADKHNIPVLINAQGIEGYDENDGECMLLKEAINKSCVKYISTRDDFTLLKNSYVVNPDIELDAVCDPAFFIEETYGIKKNTACGKKIGLNVIRPHIFSEYSKKISTDTFAALYHDIIALLSDAGYEVELFSNGVRSDTVFIDRLLSKYSDIRDKYHVSICLPRTPAELINTIASYERYMAVRLHSAIVGTVLSVPNVSLVWNRKQPLFGAQTGLTENFIEETDFNAEKIVDALLAAKPYTMDLKYKISVYESLSAQLEKWLKYE